MSNVIIEHRDGRAYSTTEAGFRELYEPQGFKIVGKESDAAFAIQGIVAPKAPRKAVRAKGKGGAARVAPPRPIANVPEPETPMPSEVVDPPVTEG